ncbi:uncharacterized protein NECHADRAFT_79494 [Fusarium vanettenii 77-13-4]|uniref:Uncharacterized protein n=1 Tax=Fusarium vanettenii (strain ATCC MYA-4622 / CBS 123669 / FGSC 9596 / NRRL 45880 / 77-13-4) TaxID=660122 RepID=C7Z7M9_FUSV7|nr:uncharacterized protein NECHADRAFT_79494 [Fusarium vanettenii 77-13-4]EEU39854.1 hypothetical protein NECHADRAFT_79494 [Fusarium vanettenii 77-13-4]
MPMTLQIQEHGNGSDLLLATRREEFRQLARIQKQLERRSKIIMFDDEQLQVLNIVRGSPFDIDEDDPIDPDPRYFLPGPIEEMEDSLELQSERDVFPWPKAKPIKNHHFQGRDESAHSIATEEACWDAMARSGFCEEVAQNSSSWTPHDFTGIGLVCKRSWRSPEDGRPRWQFWLSGDFYMRPRPGNCPRKRGVSNYNPDVPHAVGTVCDITRPRDQGFLHSELLAAVYLLKAQIGSPSRYLGHHVCPVLIVSFHARFSARIIQAYFQNGKVVIRPSRLINLHTRTVSTEVKLVIRWLNSRPVGDTRLPVQAVPVLDQVEDNFDLPVQVTDALGVSPEDTCERQATEGVEVVSCSLPTVTLFT